MRRTQSKKKKKKTKGTGGKKPLKHEKRTNTVNLGSQEVSEHSSRTAKKENPHDREWTAMSRNYKHEEEGGEEAYESRPMRRKKRRKRAIPMREIKKQLG